VRNPVFQRITTPAITLIAALSGCAGYPKCDRAACSNDAQIEATIQKRLAQEAEIEPNAITVQALDHKVYLYGEVASVLEADKAKSIARQVPGVSEVVSSIVATSK
jgi:osmotically-inducible protein OsmY